MLPTLSGRIQTRIFMLATWGALITLLDAAGVVVSNIDNGYSAGVFAARVARRAARD